MTRFEKLPLVLSLYFDGACEPRNPGGRCTYGWMLVCPTTEKIFVTGRGVAMEAGTPLSTNNVAEWAALENGLKFLAQQKWRGVLSIYGDSMLVIQQFNKKWRCKKPHLRKYRDRCHQLAKQIDAKARAFWICREDNHPCDVLSKRDFARA